MPASGATKVDVGPKRYVAVVGIDYLSEKDNKPIRVEAGEEVLGMRRAALEEELRAGNITEGIVEQVVVPTTEHREGDQE